MATWARLFKTNVSLKFQALISQIRQHFLLKKCEKHCIPKASLIFSTKKKKKKKISVFVYKVVKHLVRQPHNELLKLTML